MSEKILRRLDMSYKEVKGSIFFSWGRVGADIPLLLLLFCYTWGFEEVNKFLYGDCSFLGISRE